MLDRADQWVRVGGFLAYVTCSLDPREGEAQLNDFLEHHPNYEACAPTGLPEDLCGHLNQGNEFGYLRTTPADWHDKGGMDGFFAGVLRKIKA
jgi:16S rRNA (cytosine967-C5)-methyltransferase